MFDTDSGILECGHRSDSITIGASRARCSECGKGDERYKQVEAHNG